jgi:glycosyltransferase involved in cell wall biosynthesis
MGCHNGEKYLDDAIESILNQSCSDFEFIIIDDASTDSSWQKILGWKSRDQRIRPYQNDHNLGLAATLNRALTHANGRYIARMDADDISLPERFARQVEVLEGRNVQICGTWTRSIGRLRSRVTCYPTRHEEIRAHLFFQSPFAHPTVMLHARLYENFKYREDAGIAEDYDLWVRMSSQAVMANIPEVLLLYRVHKGQVSEGSRLKQANYAARVREMYLNQAGINVDNEDREMARQFRWPLPPPSKEYVSATEELLTRILEYYNNEKDYEHVLAKEWHLYCLRASIFGLWTWRTFRSSSLIKHVRPTCRARADLFLACLFRLQFRSRLYNLLEQFSLS